jgi:CCDC81-like prokaryotic HU domain 1/CCDC81-like prokaryotic HU domain 2/SPOR domain
MNTVQNHIKELLFEQDCVVIPEFGGFVTNFDCAKINENNRFIAPPQKWLAFNALLKNDDGLLSNYIAQEEKISREQANLHIKSFVEATKRYIQYDKTYSIEGLGTFSQNEENKIQFQQRATTNFYSESFGLENLYLKKTFIPQNELQVLQKPVVVSNNTIQQVFVSEDREPSAEVFEDAETNFEYRRNKFSRVLPVVYGLFGAAFLMSAIYFYDNQKVSLSSMNPFHSPTITHPIVKETIIEKPKAVEKVETKPFEPVVAENVVEQKETIISSNKRFFIITGSFGSEQNAKKLLRTLKNKGFHEAELIYPEKNEKLIKVAAAGFQNEFEADKQAVQISEAISQATWIYEQK